MGDGTITKEYPFVITIESPNERCVYKKLSIGTLFVSLF